MSKAERIHLYRRHWAEEIAVVVLLVGVGGTLLFFVRYGSLDENPWSYIATAIALIGAISAMMLTIAEAMRESNADD